MKKALENITNKKWNPQDYIGYSEGFDHSVNESPEQKGLMPKQSIGLLPKQNPQQDSQPQQEQPPGKPLNQDLIKQLGLDTTPMGNVILDDEDERLLYEAIDTPEKATARGKYLMDLMVDREEDQILDPKIAETWQASRAK